MFKFITLAFICIVLGMVEATKIHSKSHTKSMAAVEAEAKEIMEEVEDLTDRLKTLVQNNEGLQDKDWFHDTVQKAGNFFKGLFH